MKHSKLPWEIDGQEDIVTADGKCIFYSNLDANSLVNLEFIVTACNYHQDLMDACHSLLTNKADKDSVWRLLDEIERSVL